MHQLLPKHDLVLLGIGHTNAHVLRMWGMQPIAGTRLTCVSNHPTVTYSGMLPAVLAGQIPPERMEIDLVRLCASVGARLIVGEVTGLDVQAQQLQIADRPPLPFDVLSIGIGSVPRRDGVEVVGDLLMPIKPMQTFRDRLAARLKAVAASVNGRALRIAIVGGGAAGAEIAFCIPEGLRQTLGDTPFELTLVDRGTRLVEGVRTKTAATIRQKLETRGVTIALEREITRVDAEGLQYADGSHEAFDLVLWATGAAPPPLLAKLDLPLDERGFLQTDATLKTTATAPIFAVGDTGTIAGANLPKAGVYAVRQGPVLWDNLQRALNKQPLEAYEPQRGFLKLLNTGDGAAIGEYRGFTVASPWVLRLKNRIDHRFMDMYQQYTPMEMAAEAPPAETLMRCVGCGGKVGGSVLSSALSRLEVPKHPAVLIGLDAPDDAALVQPLGGRPLTVTADFFAAPLDDPYLMGRIAMLNSASDLFATGATPTAALALITLPVGSPGQQEQMLYEVLAGSLHELRTMGATLVGGHTIEGPRLTLGFTMLGDQALPPRAKNGLRQGDRLVLTKPLGSGILLAAHMQARCRGAWMQTLVEAMLVSNQAALDWFESFDIAAATDVTGFGLAGHLLEMLDASDLSAQVDLSAVPLLPGVAELLAEGIESTLAPANRAAEAAMSVSESLRVQPEYAALFDPQTCGGMLLAVPEAEVDRLLAQLEQEGIASAAVIGQVTSQGDTRIELRG